MALLLEDKRRVHLLQLEFEKPTGKQWASVPKLLDIYNRMDSVVAAIGSLPGAKQRDLFSEDELAEVDTGALRQYRIQERRNDGEFLVFLLGVTADGGADPTVRDFNTGKRRALKKGPTEGNDYTAHLLVMVNEFETGKHLAVLESVPGLARTGAALALMKLARPAIRSIQDLDNDKKPQRNPCNICLKPLEIQELSKTVAAGKLWSFEYARLNTDYGDVDQADVRYSRDIRATFLDKPVTGDGFLTWFPRIFRGGKEQKYETGRLKYTDREGRECHFDFNLSDSLEEVEKSLVSESTTIANLSPKLSQALDAIHEQLVERMKEWALLKYRGKE